MIRSGTVNEVTWGSGNWIFIDIGFSNKSKSCGLLFGDKDPYEVQSTDAIKDILNCLSTQDFDTNLVIEAPLSAALDLKGNPKRRKPERFKNKTRYWYVGLGCSVLFAAIYLVREMTESSIPCNIRLFEGFVSFKPKEFKSSHFNDVLALREVVKRSAAEQIIDSDNLKMDSTDSITSEFKVYR